MAGEYSELEWTGESDLEWMGEGIPLSWKSIAEATSKSQGDLGDLCLCSPCECDDNQPVEDSCACDDVCPATPCESKTFVQEDPDKCTCEPCECTLPEPEPLPVPEPSCPNCCANNVKCTCYHPPPEPPKDPLDPFTRKLENALVSNQKRFCSSTFSNLSKGRRLTTGLIMSVLLKDGMGKLAIYLPGNQLYPKILAEPIKDEDIFTISDAMTEVRGVSTLSLPYNQISDAGLEILASVLQDNPMVEHLNLMNNDIRGTGMLPFCLKAMTRDPLASLRLSGNKIGDLGYEALACLALSGHFPLDIDLSETDMGVTGYQALLAALIALETEDDYPPHYVTRGKALPVDLELLKEYKTEYVETIRNIYLKTPEKSGTADLYRLATPNQWKQYEISEIQDPISELPEPEVLEKLSATVLQKLYDISNPPPVETQNPAQLKQDYFPQEVARILDKVKGQGDLNDFITALTSERKKVPEKVTNYRTIPILRSDLYKIESVKDVYHEFLHDVDNPEILQSLEGQGDTTPIAFKGQLVDTLDSILAKDNRKGHLESESTVQDQPFTIDDHTAETAAKKYLRKVFNDTGERVGKGQLWGVRGQGGQKLSNIFFPDSSSLDDRSNVIQLVLMTIVEVVHRGQQARLAGGQGSDLTHEDCRLIMDEAIERVMNLLEPKVPEGCNLSPETVRLFVDTLFDTAEGTFINLLENPALMEDLHDTGTLAQQVQAIRQKQGVATTIATAPVNRIQYIATKFLDGVFEEAGRLIGTGDPFNYRQLSDVDYLVKMKSVDDTVSDMTNGQDPIVGFVNDIMNIGQAIATQVEAEAQATHQARKDFKLAAELLLDDLCEDVGMNVPEHEAITVQQFPDAEEGQDGNFLEQMREDLINEEDCYHIGGPRRLVMNRPLFHPGQVEVAAEMLGDYVKVTTTLKYLHIQKWQLNESGMLALMERMVGNTSLIFLDLSNNELGPDGVRLLATYLTLNPNLKHLILSHNRLRDPGITHLAKTLADSSLQSLNVAFNDLTHVGLDLLLTQVPLTDLNTLYLWGNAFGLKTWELYRDLLDSKKIQYTDTLIQKVDEPGFIVRNTQVRDTNYYYEVPSLKSAEDLVVPPYLHKPLKFEITEVDTREINSK